MITLNLGKNVIGRFFQIVAITWLCRVSVYASVINVSSLDTNTVASAINSAAPGDIVRLPLGAVSWSSTIDVTVPVTIQGPGTNALTLSLSGQPAFRFRVTKDLPIRITGISFEQPVGTTSPSIMLFGSDSNGQGTPIRSFRVDRCRFKFGKRALNPIGWCYGVVDHNTFVDCDIAVGVNGDNNGSFNRGPQHGTTNTVCIEDNVFIINNEVPRDPNQQIYLQQGANVATRFNFFDGSAYTNGNSIFFDVHGNQNVNLDPNVAFRGCNSVEVYGNRFLAFKTYQFSDFRSSSALIYSNELVYLSGGKPTQLFHLTDEESWQTAFFTTLKTNWPAQDQITNSFFWANRLNGDLITNITVWKTNDLTFIQRGRDYWMEPPSDQNGAPLGVYAGYKPLVYPHPRVTEEDRRRPFAPKNLQAVNGL